MKNKHIKPHELVPPHIRLRVYRKASKLLSQDYPISGMTEDRGLCMVLPCVLWDLENYLHKAPNGSDWEYYKMYLMFPELKDFMEELKLGLDEIGYNRLDKSIAAKRDAFRITILDKLIAKLKDETNTKTS